jgi:hypothetical protein
LERGWGAQVKGFTICETQATTIRVKVAWKIRSRRISGALRDFDLMTASQMTIPAMLDALASEEEGLPWPAIQFARENWEEVGPALIDVLNAFVEKKDCSERAHDILFFALPLMMEKRETKAFASLARLARDADPLFDILGEGVEPLMHRIFAGVFDGDVDRLWSIIESPHGDSMVRGAALQAYAWLLFSKGAPMEGAEARFARAFETLEPKDADPVWVELAMTAATLNMMSIVPLMRIACRKGYIPARIIRMKDLEDEFAIGRSDFFRHSREYVRDNGPLDDAFTQMEEWFAVGDDEEGEEEAAGQPQHEFGTPVVNPLRMIGRNDPCPCGSGKKHKKCCGAAV